MMLKERLGCNLDRHYHIGLGNIGKEGMTAVIKYVIKEKNTNCIRNSH